MAQTRRSGPAAVRVGDEVVAFRVPDGYSSALIASADDVFAKPATLSFPQAANLLLVGTTAADTLDVAGVSDGDTLLVHGAAGGVGTSVVQQAVLVGATVIGTAGERDFDAVRGFGATPVAYGPGLQERVRKAAPDGVDAAIDTVGVDEAIDVSLALVSDRRRIVSTAAFRRVKQDGFQVVGGVRPSQPPVPRCGSASGPRAGGGGEADRPDRPDVSVQPGTSCSGGPAGKAR